MLTTPFVQVGAFKAHPTFLDLLNLRSGSSSLADQTEQLNEILLEASFWVDNHCEQPLEAHVQVENERTKTNRYGQLIHKPWHTPVVSLTSVSTGTTPNALTALDVTTSWIEDGREIVITSGPLNLSTNVGPLQFGTFTYNTQFFTQWTYVAGYTNTVLSATATSGTSSIQVADATGIIAGQVLRILDPGSREAVTVANGFVPATGPATVPLAAALQFTHTFVAGTGNAIGVSALPPDIHLATIMLGVAICLRRTDTPANTAFPGSLARPSATSGQRQAGEPLIDEALRTLEPYRRVR
jgi:hypothetical protein